MSETQKIFCITGYERRVSEWRFFPQQAVKINNLPGFGSVSESVVTETLVKTLTFDSAGPHACSIDTYEPTRAEGNPFLIKNGKSVIKTKIETC